MRWVKFGDCQHPYKPAPSALTKNSMKIQAGAAFQATSSGKRASAIVGGAPMTFVKQL
jgi:hypothetical protein